MKFACNPVDINFLTNPPAFIENQIELEASAAEVFALFADEEAWPKWFKEIKKVTWTSAKPFGKGTTRTVKLTTMTVYEHFFIWEEGHRFAFYFTHQSLPLTHAFAEDYRLDDLGENRCRFTWRVCYEPKWPLIIAGPLGRGQFEKMFAKATKDLAVYIKQLKETRRSVKQEQVKNP